MGKYAAEDEQNTKKIEAKNGLENYCYSMKNTLQEEKLQDKFDAGDKDKIESAVQECLDWLERNQMAETEEFEAKQKELEGVVNPIMMKPTSRLAAVACRIWVAWAAALLRGVPAAPRSRRLTEISAALPESGFKRGIRRQYPEACLARRASL